MINTFENIIRGHGTKPGSRTKSGTQFFSAVRSNVGKVAWISSSACMSVGRG